MIGLLTVYGKNAVVDGSAMPATLYLQHHTGDPGVDGTQNVSANGPRVGHTRTPAVNGIATNVEVLETDITTPETISHFSVWDAASGGNAWWTGAYTQARQYLVGDVARVRIGKLTYQVT